MREFYLYSSIENKETYLECWGGSTKHPDVMFRFSDFQKSIWVDEKEQVFQWLLECASKMNLPYHAYALAQFAMDFERSKYNGI